MTKVNYSYILLVLIFSILLSVNSFSITKSNAKQLVVVIDPGHGGKDPGAVNKNIREKDVVLGIGLKLGKLINDNHSDVKVIYTRNTDVFVPLIERSDIANKNKADLFISIHANFCATPAIRGTETFVLGLHRSKDNLDVAKKENSVILLEEGYNTTYEGFDPNLSESYIMFELVQDIYMDQSLSFADAIQQQFKSHISTVNRGVKQAGFLVLRQSSMPSVLIESGFISNPAEASYLSSEEGQQQIAVSILEAFKKFKGKSSGATIKSEIPILASTEKTLETSPVKKQADTVVPMETKVKKEIAAIPQPEPEKAQPEKEVKVTVAETVENPIANEKIYCVQIAASTIHIEPVPGNFKGLKNIRNDKIDKYYRYYVGSESSLKNITPLLQQIKLKFPQAFVVSFVDGKRVPIYSGAK